MNDSVKLLTEYGVLVALAALFIWEKFQYSKTHGQVLSELNNSVKLQMAVLENLNVSLNGVKQSCDNTTMALNIINNTLPIIVSNLERHDKRAEFMNSDVREITALVRQRPCMVHDAPCDTQRRDITEARYER